MRVVSAVLLVSFGARNGSPPANPNGVLKPVVSRRPFWVARPTQPQMM
jgi:hypothetical protein